jgi:hypothetical protein
LSSVIQAIDPELKAAARAYGINSSLVRLIALSPVVIVVMYVFFLVFPPTHSIALYLVWGENSLVEDLTFIFLLSGGVLGLRLAWRTKKLRGALLASAFFMLFSVGLLFIAGEEVAWGETFVCEGGCERYETPSVFKLTNKDAPESSFHNSYIAGHTEFLRVAFGLGGLLGVLSSSLRRFLNVEVPAILLPWFFIIAGLSGIDLYCDYLPCPEGFDNFIARMSELVEMMVGITGFLFVWLNTRMLSSTRGREASPPVDKLRATRPGSEPGRH